MSEIRKAIIPVAGLGTRMLFLTKQTPKEMLPVAGQPMIRWGVAELLTSGIEQICLVISPQKKSIKNYFLEKGFERLDFVYQKKPLGICQALLRAEKFINNESFILLFPDQLMVSRLSATRQLINQYQDEQAAVWTSLVKIPQKEIGYFPGSHGFDCQKTPEGKLKIKKILSERATELKYQNLDFQIRGFGRIILPPRIFKFLKKAPFNQKIKEFDYVWAFKECTQQMDHYGVLLEGQATDLGTLAGYQYYTDKVWKRKLIKRK